MLFKRNKKKKGTCIVSSKITKGGWKVGYMYREDTIPNSDDSGWRFLKGDEDPAYLNKKANHEIISLESIKKIDPTIIPYLKNDKVSWIRLENNVFEEDTGEKDIYYEKR